METIQETVISSESNSKRSSHVIRELEAMLPATTWALYKEYLLYQSLFGAVPI